MRNPSGIRAESIRTPNASRAGALYATQRYSTPANNPGVARIHRCSLYRAGSDAATSSRAATSRQTDGSLRSLDARWF